MWYTWLLQITEFNTNSEKYSRSETTQITGFCKFMGVYQLSRPNCEEYQWESKYTDPNPKRKSWQNQNNLLSEFLNINSLRSKWSIYVILWMKLNRKRFLNQIEHSKIHVLTFNPTVCYKNDQCTGNSRLAHLCACFFMMQCGLIL